MIQSRSLFVLLVSILLSPIAPSAAGDEQSAGGEASKPLEAEKSAEPATPLADQLRDLFARGRCAEAEEQATRHLQTSPGDVDVRVILANCYRKHGFERNEVDAANPPETPFGGIVEEKRQTPWMSRATGELREALKTAPERKDIWLGLCQIEREASNLEGLVSCAEGAAGRFPDDAEFAEALRENVRTFLIRSEFAPAAAVLSAIAKANAADIPTLLALGRAQYMAGKKEEGVAVLERAIEVRPDDVEAHYQRAEIAAFEGDFPTAAKHFGRVVVLDALRGEAHLGFITSLQNVDRVSALRAAHAATNRWKAVPKGAPNAVIIALANQLIEQISRTSPSPTDLLNLSRGLSQAGLDAAAIAELNALLSFDGSMAEAYFLRAALLGRMGQHERAVSSLNDALGSLERQPERTFGVGRDEILSSIGTELVRLGRYAEAIESFKKVSDPDEYSFEIALANLRLGRRAEAVREFRKVVQVGKDPSQIEQARRFLSSPESPNPH